MKFLRQLDQTLEKIEIFLASIALLSMISLAFLQVVLRNGWDTGIGWADPVVRALVLWVGFLGASIATYRNSHIRFDVVAKFLPKSMKRFTQSIVFLASAIVCLLLADASYKFVLSEKEFSSMLVDNIPNWIALSIMPVGFLFISIRSFFYGIGSITGLATPHEEQVGI